MRWKRHFAWMLVLAVLSGCKKKQPSLPPPQAQAPSISTLPQPEQPQPLPPPAPPAPTIATVPPPLAKKKPKKKIFTSKTQPPKPENKLPEDKEGKSVPPGNNGEGATQLSAGLPPSEATQQRQSTLQLLSVADSNLRGLNRALSSDEQAMVQQIRAYMQQSRAADSDGDTERAYNLALKARLLSDELAKR